MVLSPQDLKNRLKPGAPVFREFWNGRGVSVNYFRQHAWLIVLLVGAIIVLIGARYRTKTSMMQIKQLRVELQQAENAKLDEKSRYMSLIRETDMVKRVGEAKLGLVFREQPPYELKTDE